MPHKENYMTYVMSDIHGQYDKYLKMLEKINFSDSDELYIIGDVVDRGDSPIKILVDMSMRYNVFPILGNHDYMAEYFLKKLNTEITDDNFDKQFSEKEFRALSGWIADGGNTTLREFRKLSPDEREAVLDYLSEFSLYEEISVNGRSFVLVHGGLPDFSPEKRLCEYDGFGIIIDRPDYTRRYFGDKYLVTGHTPTVLIDEKYDGRIYMENGHIAIDCGAGWGNRLGCVRLDDFEEFYVD